MTKGILDGVRVVDIAAHHAASLAGLILAESGADVVKIEVPGRGKTLHPVKDAIWNRSKTKLPLDLSSSEGRAKLEALMNVADILLHDLTPAQARKLDLDDETLTKSHPGLIPVSIGGWPARHAKAERPVDDAIVLAEAGFFDEQQPVEREGPMFLRAPIGSWHAAWLAVSGAISRLIVRGRTGQTGPVRTSLLQGALIPQMMHWSRAQNPTPGVAIGMTKRAASVPTLYQCGDGLWIHIMGNPLQAPDIASGFAGMSEEDKAKARAAYNPDDVKFNPDKGILDLIFKTKPQKAWLEQLWASDVPAQPVLTMGALYKDEQTQINGYCVEIDDPVLGKTMQPGVPLEVKPAVAPKRAPKTVDWPKRTARATGGPAPRRLLEGVRVLDFGNYLAGPLAPQMMSDLGADVIRIEATAGDPMRPTEWPFNACQRGKRAIALQLKDPAVRPVIERLVKSADIVHHNLRLPAATRLGLDYETLRAINPKLIYCHVSSYGPKGPRKDWPGYDQLFQASAGWEAESAGEGNRPTWLRFGMMDHQCAAASLVATLLALYHRERTGEGQFVAASLLGASLLTAETVLTSDGTLTPYAKLDKDQMGVSPARRIYQCADGWALAAAPEIDEEAPARLLKAAGVASLGALEAKLAGQRQTDALALFESAQIPGAPVALAQRYPFFDSAENERAGLIARYPHPVYGQFEQPGALWDFGDLELAFPRAPAILGQHTREILTEIGFSAAEIDTLIAKGAAKAA